VQEWRWTIAVALPQETLLLEGQATDQKAILCSVVPACSENLAAFSSTQLAAFFKAPVIDKPNAKLAFSTAMK
jgi:hypothetical protein